MDAGSISPMGPAAIGLEADLTARAQMKKDEIGRMLERAEKVKVTEEEALKVGQDFEAMFLTEMLEHMWDGIGTDGLFGGGNGERIFRSFAIQEYARFFAERGGVGIAQAVQRSLLQLQEVK